MTQKPKRKVIQPNKEKLMTRMNRVSGQINGIAKMIENDRYCVDILKQLAAARAALKSVGMVLLEDHTKHCVHDALSKKNKGNEIIEELIDVIKKFG